MNRIVQNLPASEYHADLLTISKHGLDLVHKAPALYAYKKTTAHTETRSPAMRWGTLVHLAVLEPHLLDAETVVAPDVDKRTKAGRDAWAELAASGREVITEAEAESLRDITAAVRSHPAAAALLAGETEIENSVYWEDAETGILCRARPDLIRCDGIVVDLKTTMDAGQHDFSRAASNYRYHVQAAFYLDGLKACGVEVDSFAFIAVEKEAPYLVSVYAADDVFLAKGRQAYQADLATYKACLESNTWPGYSREIQPLSLPAWATR